ncbi:hypothetical protein TUMSATVNIG1_61060 (plasmid) [Vibrio nigripulchritudo]|uniref:hypothetical protein n=1 Tax=Vibrio nigripulchritudo TaxID=28173 RepID=UPI001909E8BE|nr:hypothetical protein [Vibrio nigripulchritudo]BCL74122.1 hypothetical protein VNTUMSATTG_60590 [Vibrio nigripulchritudo]BDU35497.1 hypothetical protein TUMSATVNIG1_61060 [Vibrio nigripulchritudo]
MTNYEREVTKIIEQARFQVTTERFVELFIKDWTFQHCGLFPLTSEEVELCKRYDLETSFKALSHIIFMEGVVKGVTDPIGFLFNEFSNKSKSNAYFPTPSEVSSLLIELILPQEQIVKPSTFSEPCGGTGSIILTKLEKIYFRNIELEDPLRGMHFHVEEIDPLLCRVLFLQFLFKCQHLQMVGGKPANPSSFVIQNIDVISRREGSVHFYMTSPDFEESRNKVALESVA